MLNSVKGNAHPEACQSNQWLARLDIIWLDVPECLITSKPQLACCHKDFVSMCGPSITDGGGVAYPHCIACSLRLLLYGYSLWSARLPTVGGGCGLQLLIPVLARYWSSNHLILFAGFVPNFARLASFNVVLWLSYEVRLLFAYSVPSATSAVPTRCCKNSHVNGIVSFRSVRLLRCGVVREMVHGVVVTPPQSITVFDS